MKKGSVKKVRKFYGSPPVGGMPIGEFYGFTLFYRVGSGSFPQLNFKLAANGHYETKANYWLSFNVENMELGGGRDIKIMEEHYPDMAKAVSGAIREFAIAHQWPEGVQ